MKESCTPGLRFVLALTVGAGALVLLLAVGFVMRNARVGAEGDAATQLSQAQYHLWSNNTAQAIELSENTAPPFGVSKKTMSQCTCGQVSPVMAEWVWVSSSFIQ